MEALSLINPVDPERLDKETLRIYEICDGCRRCFNHCPYTPSHQYELDFPHLMILWKKRLAVERGVRWRDWLLIKTDLIGRLGSLTAPLTNWLLNNRFVRLAADRFAGVHRDRQVLHFSAETFSRWFSRRARAASTDAPVRRVALFASCLVNY